MCNTCCCSGPKSIPVGVCQCRKRPKMPKSLKKSLKRMETLIMTTREELHAKLDEAKSDAERVIGALAAARAATDELRASVDTLRTELEAANAAADLSDIDAKVEEISAALDAAEPEPVEVPPTEEPPVELPPVEEPPLDPGTGDGGGDGEPVVS